jgi:hypothetical protein
MKLLEQGCHICRIAPFRQFFIDAFDIVVTLRKCPGAWFNHKRLEAAEYLTRHNFEAALGFVICIDRLHRIREAPDTREALCPDQGCWIKAKVAQMCLGRFDCLDKCLHPFFNRRDDIFASIAVIAKGILREGGIQIGMGKAKLLPTVFIDQLDCRAIFFRALEIIAGDIIAKDALGDFILLEKRCSGETDESGVG